MPHKITPFQVLTPLPDRSVLERVGNTPLIKVHLYEREFPQVEIYAKAEWFNPGGSVKDRPALRMIEEAERTGELTRERVILDSTSGNTGVAYALIGAAKGFRVRLVMPESVSEERKALVRAYGAEVVFSSGLEGSDGAIREAHRLRESDPARYYMPDQYNNPFNWRAHFDTTGPEVLDQSHHEITHFVAGIGTGGTLAGVGRFLKKHRPATQVVAVEPDDALHGLEGLKFMETSIVPGIYDPTVHDQKIRVNTEEAYAVAARLAREEGLLVGHSSGAALLAARAVAEQIGQGVIVTIFPDGGDRYLSRELYRRR